jgi:hypothetical protein
MNLLFSGQYKKYEDSHSQEDTAYAQPNLPSAAAKEETLTARIETITNLVGGAGSNPLSRQSVASLLPFFNEVEPQVTATRGARGEFFKSEFAPTRGVRAYAILTPTL